MPITATWPATLPGPSDDNYSWVETPRVRAAKFGDGYEQRTADGLNTRPRSLTLDWPNLLTADKDTMLNFLRARNGVEGFLWTPPGEGAAIKVKGTTWTVKRKSGPYWTVTVTFEEVFDQ